MKRIRLISISIICIITFNIGLTGCANMKDKYDNNLSTTSNTNGTSIPNSSLAPTTVISTQSNSFLSGKNNETVDYNQYIKKVWITKNSTNEINPSFCIYEIVNGNITGNYSYLFPAVHSIYNNSNNLSGTINKDTAECQFDNGHGIRGNIKLIFITNDEIEATIEYLDLDESYSFPNKRTYQFTPYNIGDIEDFVPIESQSFMVDLNSWGNVKFVSGKIEGDRYTDLYFFLTDTDENILYEFSLGSTMVNLDVAAVSFKDVTKDGLKDIIIILNTTLSHHGRIEPKANVFFQKNNGTFANDSKLDQEINDSGNNKDIKAIMDYLSKKF